MDLDLASGSHINMYNFFIKLYCIMLRQVMDHETDHTCEKFHTKLIKKDIYTMNPHKIDRIKYNQTPTCQVMKIGYYCSFSKLASLYIGIQSTK